MPDAKPRFSIIIPVKPGGQVAAIRSLRALTYPSASYEVLVAEGTRPSMQRNLAAGRAGGELFYFLDDDSLIAPDALWVAADALSDPAVAVVGGPSLTPATDSPFQRAIGCAVSSLLGSGGVRNRYRRVGVRRITDDRELILCNLCFRGAVFLAEGGLDARLYPNEENELLDRLQGRGYRLLHDPELAIWRSQRPNMRSFCRQMYGYGRGRGEQTRISSSWPPSMLIPPLFLLYLLSLLLLHPWWYMLPLAAYLLLVVGNVLLSLMGRTEPAVAVRLLWLIPLMHLLYGAGIIVGLLQPRFSVGGAAGASVSIRHVKHFDQEWGDVE